MTKDLKPVLPPKTYYLKTFGCQMNISDSERIAGFLESKGYETASSISDAALVIFNTCGVRQAAENRVYSLIHNLRVKSEKSKVHKVRVVLTGCLANRKDVQRRLKDKVDLFCEIKNFPEKIKNILATQSAKTSDVHHPPCSFDIRCPNEDYLNIIPKYQNNFQAFIPIMTGCNNFCSYCVVPYARGREASRPAEEIIAEVKNLVKLGYKSITLLGQNVNSYKSKVHKVIKSVKSIEEINFSKLLKEINKIPGKFWIQFVSSHPKDMSDELIETIAESKKVCELIHLPIQSGSDEILAKMNRKYTAKHYLNLVRKIRSAFKKHKPETLFALTSDIIVGFPTETKKQFLQSAEIMQKAKYDMVYFGQYSPRPGTAAWKMKDNVSKAEKAKREQFLNEILKKTTFKNNKKYLNTAQEVLIEKEDFPRAKLLESKSLALGKQHIYFGKTRTGKNVKIISNKKDLIGKFVKVKITKANVWNLEGTMI